jgi:gentisate 1,2-dioxygenase
VIDGEGESDIDGTIFRWSRGDVFVAPGWRKHQHTASTQAHLLRVTDEPVLQRLHWFRTL